jgi:predicted Zn-dependent peptidase
MQVLRYVLIAFLFVNVAVGSVIAADSLVDVNINVNEFQLDNGMLFLVVERPATPQVACRLAIRAGSALEESGKTGIAHLLEHMMFKGTQNFGTLDRERDKQLQVEIEVAYQIVRQEQLKRTPDHDLINKKLAEMERLRQEVQKYYIPQVFSSQLGKNGAVGINAFTSHDQTQYMASVPADMLEQWFSIISEQLFEPAWREFYVEKEVVQREWAYRYINNPGGAAWLDLYATAYSAHPYRNPVIGWKSDMERYSTQDAVAFHKKYYNPSNAVVVMVGDITVEAAKRLAELYFGRYPAGERAPEKVTAEPIQQGPRKSIRYLKGARTPLVRIGLHGAAMGTRDFYALDAMTMILSYGRSARLTQDVTNKGLAVEAWAYNPDNRYAGMVILGGSPNEPAKVTRAGISQEEKHQAYTEACEELEKILLAAVEKMKVDLVSPRELQRIKKLNQRDFLERMRSNEKLAGTLATIEVQAGWPYLTEYLAKIEAVTPEDIRQAARKYIHSDNQTSVYVIPGGKPSTPPQAYTEIRSIGGSAAAQIVQQGSRQNHSNYPTPADWKHPLAFERKPKKVEYPAADTFTIRNSTVFFLVDRELPLIDLTLLIKAGSVDVEASKTGLTDLFNRTLIQGGTEQYSPNELALVLDDNAIRVSVSVGLEMTSVNLSVLKSDWEKGLNLLEEILTKPRFDSGVLKISQEQEIMALKRQGGSAQAVAMREAMVWHFSGHPYGRDPLHGLQTIPDITLEDLKQFLRTYFVPSNTTVAISGDIGKEQVVSGLDKLFKSFPNSPAPQRQLTDPAATPPVLALVHKPGQVQSQVIMTMPSVKRTDPDFWKISLLMNIFGGKDSLLYTRLRDDLGLVYSAGFHQTYKWSAGLLVGYIGCKGDRTGASIIESLKIMDDLKNEIPEKDLELKRLDALNSFVFNVDTKADLVGVYGRYAMRREPLDTLDKIQDAFLSAEREELRKLAGKLFNSQKLQIFVVGDKSIPIKTEDGKIQTLEQNLMDVARQIGVPYQEIELR